jgi:predicted ribosomally synthesized peptide with SipW-like signal peptide
MTDYTISHRSVLAGLGTIGIASAGAGLGTTAFFGDEEQVSASLQAGKMDLKLDYRATYLQWNRATDFDSLGVIPAPTSTATARTTATCSTRSRTRATAQTKRQSATTSRTTA